MAMAHELEAELHKARKRIKFLEESVIRLGAEKTKNEGYRDMFLAMKESWIAVRAKYTALKAEYPSIPDWDTLMKQIGAANNLKRGESGGGPRGLIG